MSTLEDSLDSGEGDSILEAYVRLNVLGSFGSSLLLRYQVGHPVVSVNVLEFVRVFGSRIVDS